MNRRNFLKYSGAAILSLSELRVFSLEKKEKTEKKITILYTNDQHSRIDPFPDNDPKWAGRGGFAKRAGLIKEIRAAEEHVLVLDAGDIFQGTPYFNYYQGELEYRLMTQMGYDATTLGNHDFDGGMDNIVKQLPHAGFSILNCNYDLTGTVLEGKIIPFKVFTKGHVKIGVLGVGIELEGLVDKRLYGAIKYNDPVTSANRVADELKNKLKCDYVVCLSHLGYKYDSDKISDRVLGASTKNIDLIIGGHTHTFLNEPESVKNMDGREVLITQVGWAGMWLGRIDILFGESSKKVSEKGSSQKI